jgi:hypothetical protein
VNAELANESQLKRNSLFGVIYALLLQKFRGSYRCAIFGEQFFVQANAPLEVLYREILVR